MADTGSLIQLHKHNNFEVLEYLEDSDGKLYYKDVPIYTAVSESPNNAITTLTDGIFVDNTYFLSKEQYELLSKFSFKDNELYYDGIIVSREYQNNQIDNMISSLWNKLDTEDAVTGGDST